VAEEVPIRLASTVPGGAGAEVAPPDPQDPPVTVEAAPSGPRVPAEGPEVTLLPTATEGRAARIPSDVPSTVGVGGAPSSVPPPTPRSLEVILGRSLRSGTESEATLTPLPQVLSRAHQALQETEVAIWREWEALETEHQRLGDWCTQLEEHTKAVSCHFASERAEFEQEREDFKEDIRKVSDQEEEVIQKEKSLARKEVRLDQREEAVTALHATLKAYNTVLEKQRDKQAAAEVKLQKLQQELADRASDIARAEGSLKAGEASLAKRTAGLTRQEEDLTFREEMWARWNKLLDELELEAEERRKRLEEKVQALEEQVRQFRAAQVAQATQTSSGPQAVEAMRKTLDDLRAEQRAGGQRIAAWDSEASTALVPLGVSPIPALVRPASISDVLPVLDSTPDHLRRLDQTLGARLEAEGSRLCRSAIEYVLTCFRSHDPAVSLGPVIAGPVADAEDAAREGM
jgi:predicted  nucleic acid-binding Zn-ribbon protein